MEILELLDWERRMVVYPGVTRFSEEGVIKDLYEDGKSGEIVYSSCTEGEVDSMIRRQILAAQRGRYDLEWKVYGHDQPHCLGERLTAAGFEAGAREKFMVFLASENALSHLGVCDDDIRKVTNAADLGDYRSILEEVRGESCDKEMTQYGVMLDSHPNYMSIYVAYVEGEPAACGRVYFHEDSKFAALYGGNTRERFRGRGLFTRVVAARIREALSRGVRNVCVDALPTSEPILRKRGFEILTSTQPFFFTATE
ncbi:N-acetyltransferase [Capsulimonas corticalis]|uniref:N-acetyltransferase n=1 Tax=Capsulimonas corticalis TaxID=2219043 RepID=A0A402CNQ6_9BACT|nr:GNAT family N-acetyltransferase [Capsulimonas corticalis]BDI33263.1 N-acetyltransferase [Capsulimonas corticalis]